MQANKNRLSRGGYDFALRLTRFGGVADFAVCRLAGIECTFGCLEYGLTSAVLHNRLLSLLLNTYSEFAV